MKRTFKTHWPSILLAVVTAWMVSVWLFPVIAANNGFVNLAPTGAANQLPVTNTTTTGDYTWRTLPNAPNGLAFDNISHLFSALGAPSTGTVTSVATGCGVSGGPITTTGTVSRVPTVNAQSGASYAFQDSDCGKQENFTNAGAVALSIAQAGSGGLFVSGWFTDYICTGAGGCTLTPATSTVNGAATLVLTQFQNVRLWSNGTNYFANKGSPSGATCGGDLSGTFPNCLVVKFTTPTGGPNPNGISITVTAGAVGVTQNLLAAKDASNPTLYVTVASGGCGSGFAATTATSGNAFELYVVPGLILTGVADNAITAGHILVGGTTTPGRVKDSGQTSRTAIASGTCIVGVANANATAGNTVALRYDGVGTFGQISQHSITFVIDGGGSAIATGDIKSYPTAAYACTINRIDISADQSGSITVDVWKAAGAIPTSGNKISASAPLTLSSAQLAQNGSLTGWTTSVASGDVFGFSVATVATVTRVIGQIWCQ